MSDNLRFAFVGDLCLGEEFIVFANKHGLDYLYPFKPLINVFSDVDIGVVNLEGPTSRGYDLRSNVTVHLFNNPLILDFLHQHNFKVLSLANNHILDMGREGLEKTLEMIKKTGLLCIGAGLDRIEANREVIYECKSRKIAFLSFTTNETNVRSIIAGHDKPGCASFADIDIICERINKIRRSVDIVCVSMHWGFEYFQYPSSDQVKIAHSLVDAGANYVIGHHPHVIQGIEVYKGSLIIYSLGNFFFPPVRTSLGRLQYQKDISKEVMILKSEINSSNEISYRIIGGKIKADYAYALYDEESQSTFDSKVEKLSKPLYETGYERFWEEYKTFREREIQKESFIEAYKKFVALPTGDKIKAISLADIKRNLSRFKKLLLNSK